MRPLFSSKTGLSNLTSETDKVQVFKYKTYVHVLAVRKKGISIIYQILFRRHLRLKKKNFSVLTEMRCPLTLKCNFFESESLFLEYLKIFS